MFGLDSPLGLFPPGMDPAKMFNPLMDMSDPRGMSGDHPTFMKKKSKLKIILSNKDLAYLSVHFTYLKYCVYNDFQLIQ